MASSLSDFATKVAAQVSPSGAIFRVQNNADGSLTIFRSASGNSLIAGGPTSPWVPVYPRVIYNYALDTVIFGDGSSMSTSPSAAFIAGMQ